ncbi:ATP-binding protein [Mongoliimonas terrestris]|uniref:PAS domain-containing sensor histidine kinase n=1 Tax=Mongoliimonas terrestris TaxID=1709001 RepID=UPI0009499B23|nr:ATP-binding protein [Mongoliimonas terrestris]
MADLDDVFLAAAADPSVAALIEDARPVFLFDRRGSRLLFVNAAGADHLDIRDRAGLEGFRLLPGHPTARRVAAIDGQLGPGQARTDRVPLSRSVVPQSVVCRASRFRFAGERGILLVVLDAATRYPDASSARAAFEALFAAPAERVGGRDEPAPVTADAAEATGDGLANAEAPALVADDHPPAVVTDPMPLAEPPSPPSLQDADDLPDLGADYGQEDPTAGAADPDEEARGSDLKAMDDEAGDAGWTAVAEPGRSDADAGGIDTEAADAAGEALDADGADAEVTAENGAFLAADDTAVEPVEDHAAEAADGAVETAGLAADTAVAEDAAVDGGAPTENDPPVADDGLPEMDGSTGGDQTEAGQSTAGTAEDTAGTADEGAGTEEAAAEHEAGAAEPGFRFPDHGRSVRFVFELDHALAFAFVSEDLAGVVGPAAAPRLGDTWADLAARMDLDPRGRVQSALARHDTFTGLTVDWPVDGGMLRLPVDLAGMPVFARDRAFRGYRGFGIAKTGAAFSVAPMALPPVADVSLAHEEPLETAPAEDVRENAPADEAAEETQLLEPVAAPEDLPALDERVADADRREEDFAAERDAEATDDAVAAEAATSTDAADEVSQSVDADAGEPSGLPAEPVEADETEAGAAAIDAPLTDAADADAEALSGPRVEPGETDETDAVDAPATGTADAPSTDTANRPSADMTEEPAAEAEAPAAGPSPASAARSPARGDGLAAALLAAAAAAAVAGHRTSLREPTTTVEPSPSDAEVLPSEPSGDAVAEQTATVVTDAESAPTLPVAVPLADAQAFADDREGVVIGLDPDQIYAAESLLFGGMTEPPPPEDAVLVSPADAVAFAGIEGAVDPDGPPAAESWPGEDAGDTVATPSDMVQTGDETDGDPQPDVDDGFAAIAEDTTIDAAPDEQPETLAPLAEPTDTAAAAGDGVDEGNPAFDGTAVADEPDAAPREAVSFGAENPLDLVEEPNPEADDVAWSERTADVIPSPMVARSVPPEPPLSAADAARRQLSRPEREAFQKIAEALGARLHDSHAAGRADKGGAPTPGMDAPAPLGSPADGGPPAEPGVAAGPDGTALRGAFASGPMLELAVLDRLPVAVALLRHGEAIAANRAFLDLAGYADLAALDAAGGFAEAFVGSPLIRDHRLPAIRRRDGVEVPVHVRLHSVPFEGAMASMLVVQETAKATGPIRAETAEARVGELEAILDTATDGVLLIDTSGRILGANRSAEALFGAEREAMVGAPLIDYLAPESHRNALDYLDGLSRNGVASVLNDGREVIGRVRRGGLVPLFMTVGRVSAGRFCAVLRDITQWKRAEEELTTAKRSAENASSQKSDFLAKISHEIRTPLNAIIGFSEVMMEERFGPVGSERYKEYLRDIHMSGSLIMSLVNDLLDLSKIEAGKLDLAFEAVPVNEVVRECVALMQPQANRERIIIRTSLSSSLPNVVADHRSLRQIVLNLLSNAIKFNQPGGQVIVSTLYEDSGEVALRVRDTGPGMSADDVEKALEPFRQLHTTRPGRGTGLGLPLTKALVEANRAAFRIDSAPGQGTLVQVTFPSTRVLAE